MFKDNFRIDHNLRNVTFGKRFFVFVLGEYEVKKLFFMFVLTFKNNNTDKLCYLNETNLEQKQVGIRT